MYVTEQVFTQTQWRLHHDEHGASLVPEQIVTFDAVQDIIKRLSTPEAGKRYKACGSHWALSTAAITDNISVETNFPVDNPIPRLSGLSVDLGLIATDQFIDYLVNNPPTTGNAIATDPCLQYRFGPFFVHLKAGTRIYEAYSLLDRPNDELNNGQLVPILRSKLAQQPRGRSDAYDGPWAFATLGGAGGQTVFGALTTGTHGGDYNQGPISNYVAAIHLVGYGGQQFWIEPVGDRQPVQIAEESKLAAHFPQGEGPDRIKVIRDNNIFDAVVVGAGRFGVVTSIVVGVVPQYCLLEHRELADWSGIKSVLLAQKHQYFDTPFFTDPHRTEKIAIFERRFGNPITSYKNRFLQIAVNVSPHLAGEHRCGVTQRWWVPAGALEATYADGTIPGRAERGTPEMAGLSFPYHPPDPPEGDEPPGPREKPQTTGTFLERACASGSFFAGILKTLAEEIEKIIEEGFVPSNSAILIAIDVGTGGAILPLAASLCATLAAAALLLKELADLIEDNDDTSLASAVHGATKEILDNLPKPVALMILRFIMLKVFESQQGYRDYVAISYAVMDGHDYHDRSCFSDAQSLEVFFDAAKPDVYCAYLDQILAFEAAQQNNDSRVTVGYVSLRYVQGGHALIGPARFRETVVMEVAEIRYDDGSAPFVANAAAVARHPMFAAPFHWGQFNPLTHREVDQIFNAPPKPGALNKWRDALSLILRDQVVKDGFSSGFTRQTGLEP